jgi:hypothetical protein
MKYEIGQRVKIELNYNFSMPTEKELEQINYVGTITEISLAGFYHIENVANWINEELINEIIEEAVVEIYAPINDRFEILDL